MIKANKIATTADIMAPLTKTLGKLKSAIGARNEHIEYNKAQIQQLELINEGHAKEIAEANAFIKGFETTFGIKE